MENNTLHDDAVKFRKLFIGGLKSKTTDESLYTYFRKWGRVVDCVVMKTPTTGKSRGFGYVIYQTTSQLDDVQANRPHTIDGKKVTTKRPMPWSYKETMVSTKKMFVSGLTETTSKDEIRKIFAKFGTVKKVDLIKDKNTGKRKPFCFVSFDDYDSVDKCVIYKSFPLGSTKIKVQKAVSKTDFENDIGSKSLAHHEYNNYRKRYVSDWNQGNFNYAGYRYHNGGCRYQKRNGRDNNGGYGNRFGSYYANRFGGGYRRTVRFSRRSSGHYDESYSTGTRTSRTCRR